MVVEIKDDVFIKENLKTFSHLLNIIFKKPKGSINTKAKLLVDISIVDSELFDNLYGVDRELIEDSIKEMAYKEEAIVADYFISEINGDDRVFNLEEALIFLEEPLYIVLENVNNDAHFIKSIISYFDDENQYVIDSLKNRWIVFDNGGGSATKSLLRSKIESFEEISLINNSNPIKFIRALVILDSDKEYREQTSSKNESLIKFITDNGFSYHVLEKREMENYMPDSIFLEIEKQKLESKRVDDQDCLKWIRVYKNLSEEQKDFLWFDIKAANFENLNKEIKELYKNHEGENYNILKKGFRYRDYETHGLEDSERRFKNAFPCFFTKHPLVNRQTLNKRCGNDELERIYSKIKKLI